MNKPWFVQLGDIAEFINGCAFKPEDWHEAGLPIIRIQNLTNPDAPFNRTGRIVPEKYRVVAGDLLVSWSATLGVFSWDGPDALVNQHIFKVVADTRQVNLDYLRHALDASIHEMEKFTHGSTMKHINRAEFLGHRIPLPDLDEQRRIAAILDKADELRQKRKRAIAMLDSLTQSIFLDMFGGPKGAAIPRLALSEVTDVIRDGAHSTPSYVETGVPFVTVRNITSGRLDLSQTKFVSETEHAELTKRVRPERGDVLVSKDGTIGVPCLVDTDVDFSIFVSVALLKLKKYIVDPLFIVSQLSTDDLQKQIRDSSKGIAIRHLHLKDFARLKVAVPPMDLQKKFVARVSEQHRIAAELVGSKTNMDALFSSLQHRAFSGQL